MMKLQVLAFYFMLSLVNCNRNGKIMICKSVSSIFDLDIEPILDNVPSGIERETAGESNTPPLLRLKQQLREIKDKLQCLDGVVAGGKCYRLLYRVGIKVTFLQAGNLCSFHGGLVAEIPNQEVYEAVFGYVRKYWSVDLEATGRNFVQVFLNSQYENGRALLRNGENAYLTWHPRYPTSNPDHSRMLISITINNNHPPSENGMFNYNVGYTAMPLCEFELE